MTHTQKLESITRELQSFSKNYISQNEVCLGKEMEDAANAINHLIKIYNDGYEGYELDILNKQISQKLSFLHKAIRVKLSDRKDDTTIYILGSLYNYSAIIKMTN